MHYEPDPIPPTAAVRERVSMPGIFLAVIGVINVLAACFFLFRGYQAAQTTPAEFDKKMEQLPPQQRQQVQDFLKQVGWSTEKFLSVATEFLLTWGGVALFGGLVSVLGGICMAKLRSYGLAMTGAILAAIPFVSPLGCCLVGEVVGIWSLIVLFNADVRMAFSGGSPPAEGGPMR